MRLLAKKPLYSNDRVGGWCLAENQLLTESPRSDEDGIYRFSSDDQQRKQGRVAPHICRLET